VLHLRSRFSCVEVAAVRKLRFACMVVKHGSAAPLPQSYFLTSVAVA